MMHARVLVAVHGAALTNMAFQPPFDSSVIEIVFSPRKVRGRAGAGFFLLFGAPCVCLCVGGCGCVSVCVRMSASTPSPTTTNNQTTKYATHNCESPTKKKTA